MVQDTHTNVGFRGSTLLWDQFSYVCLYTRAIVDNAPTVDLLSLLPSPCWEIFPLSHSVTNSISFFVGFFSMFILLLFATGVPYIGMSEGCYVALFY